MRSCQPLRGCLKLSETRVEDHLRHPWPSVDQQALAVVGREGIPLRPSFPESPRTLTALPTGWNAQLGSASGPGAGHDASFLAELGRPICATFVDGRARYPRPMAGRKHSASGRRAIPVPNTEFPAQIPSEAPVGHIRCIRRSRDQAGWPAFSRAMQSRCGPQGRRLRLRGGCPNMSVASSVLLSWSDSWRLSTSMSFPRPWRVPGDGALSLDGGWPSVMAPLG